jgi:glycosyltransferase involved in cell wall biosynthesis
VDDASTDDTVEVVRAAGRRCPVPLRSLRLPRNSGGPARPINTGVAAARSELIAVLDQDDTFLPQKIESQARILSENPGVALAAGFCGMSDDDEPDRIRYLPPDVHRQLGIGSVGSRPVVFPGREFLRALILRGNFLVGYPAFLFRKADWGAKGGVDERLRVASDYDFLCWLCSRGDVALQPAVQYVRREHETNVCNDRQKMCLEVTRVKARYLAGQPWLRDDPAVATAARDWFHGYGYWLREAGNYGAARECYCLAAAVWGWDGALVRAVCKLPLVWAWRKLSRQPPVDTFATRPRAPAAKAVPTEPVC